ncbi:MAG TPA: GNAT family N-acetyltransferase [Gemmatimonadaceae bacterium]|jgi:ribosomal protein S18 acetylase RimI-like enzyme|nr:GNAT family N-acetyltransferase [Gemmatimonadaceae bacterium]
MSRSRTATHVLDNPIWHALTTAHAGFAEGNALARRYPPDVTPLAAMARPTARGYAALGAVLRPQRRAALFVAAPPTLPDGWQLERATDVWQMIWADGAGETSEFPIVDMRPRDAAEMVALATLAQPGPLTLRALELGRFLGIRAGGELVALAGERLRLNGYVEISGVCTHPDHRGRGYAQALVTAVARRIARESATPFLHVNTANASAAYVYEKLGFQTRRRMQVAVLTAPG